MTKRILATLILLCSSALAQVMGFNVGGRTIASQYGLWQASNTSSINAGLQTLFLDRCYVVAGNIAGKQFVPFATNAPIKISDQNPETVLPTTVASPLTGSTTCSVTATFAFPHPQGATVTSASGGLAESINDLLRSSGGIITIDPSWTGTTSNITSFTGGSTSVFLEDLRSAGVTYWKWNGSQFQSSVTSFVLFGNGSQATTTNLLSAPTANNCVIWLAGGALGDLGGICTNATQLQGRNVASQTPSDGQALAWNQAGNQWVPQTIAGGGGGASLGYVAVSFSSTPTFTPSPVGSCTFEITLTGNVTSSTFTSGLLAAGTLFVFVIHQDATGGRTFTWPSTANDAPMIGLTANQTTVQQYVWNGSALEAMSLPVIFP